MAKILVCGTSCYDHNKKGLGYIDSGIISNIGRDDLKREKANSNNPLRKIQVLDGGTPTRAHHDDGRGM